MTAISLFCQTPKNGGQTLILSLGVVGCNDGISSEFRKVTEEGYFAIASHKKVVGAYCSLSRILEHRYRSSIDTLKNYPNSVIYVLKITIELW
ncbi:MAG: hypothetical protein F6K14_34370 [Symploca sp. SIO2C1]|nr:hypothetical protein [Symploca sp. SIO2C1]